MTSASAHAAATPWKRCAFADSDASTRKFVDDDSSSDRENCCACKVAPVVSPEDAPQCLQHMPQGMKKYRNCKNVLHEKKSRAENKCFL